MKEQPLDNRMPALTRRRFLALATAGFSAPTTGCLTSNTTTEDETPVDSATPSQIPTTTPSPSQTSDVIDTTATPIEDGQASPAPSCPDGYHPLDPNWVVHGPGPLGGFELSLDTRSIALGDTLTAHALNVTDEPQETAVKQQYDIQYQGESGWHSIFGTEMEQPAYNDLAYRHGPGEGFTWELPFTEEGLTGTSENTAATYYVCDTLTPGAYRFVYWGARSEKLENREYAIGRFFTVSGD